MARIFAGIFGPLAFLVSLARGALHGAVADSTLLTAWCSLLAFSALGCVVGAIAESTVEQSVGAILAARLSAEQTTESTKVPGGPT